MWAVAVKSQGRVAVETQYAQVIGPVILQPAVKTSASTKTLSIFSSSALNVIDGEEFQLSFFAAVTPPAVVGDNFLLQVAPIFLCVVPHLFDTILAPLMVGCGGPTITARARSCGDSITSVLAAVFQAPITHLFARFRRAAAVSAFPCGEVFQSKIAVGHV